MDEVINYRELSEEEKDRCLKELMETSFGPAHGRPDELKREMDKSEEGTLPQYVFVRRAGRVIGYLFLIGETENAGRLFPWWAVDNADELPLETDLRLLRCGVELCQKAGCRKLARRLQSQIENHQKGIGRRPADLCR